MKKKILLLVILGLMCCGCFASLQRYEFLETSHEANYKRVFGHEKPADIQIINSVVVDYKWRPWTMFVNGTDDWEFGIIAPRSWIDEQIKRFYLTSAKKSIRFDSVQDRKENPIRKWYAPKPIESYESYYEYATSIDYVHMLVDKEKVNDNLYRVFISKH